MTHMLTESELEKLTDAELRLKLSEAFNALGGLRKSSQEYARTTASVDTIKRVLVRRLHAPQP